jgi:hypothetical protein
MTANKIAVHNDLSTSFQQFIFVGTKYNEYEMVCKMYDRCGDNLCRK